MFQKLEKRRTVEESTDLTQLLDNTSLYLDRAILCYKGSSHYLSSQVTQYFVQEHPIETTRTYVCSSSFQTCPRTLVSSQFPRSSETIYSRNHHGKKSNGLQVYFCLFYVLFYFFNYRSIKVLRVYVRHPYFVVEGVLSVSQPQTRTSPFPSLHHRLSGLLSSLSFVLVIE